MGGSYRLLRQIMTKIIDPADDPADVPADDPADVPAYHQFLSSRVELSRSRPGNDVPDLGPATQYNHCIQYTGFKIDAHQILKFVSRKTVYNKARRITSLVLTTLSPTNSVAAGISLVPLYTSVSKGLFLVYSLH